MEIELTVNGKLYRADVPVMKPLLAVLRDDIGLWGAKEGCGEGECGACSVLMNGRLVNACLVPAVQASGSELLTIEGLGSSDSMDMLQRAFVTEGAVQCGFCTPGMVLAARALLEENPSPTEDETRIAISGNICRCTGYENICRAVEKAVRDGYCKTFLARGNLCSGRVPVSTDSDGVMAFVPQNLEEALEMLDANPDASLLAGSTDILPDIKNGKFRPEKIIDLSRVRELTGIEITDDFIRIGGCVTNGDIIRSRIVRKHLPALFEASAQSGAPAVQNRATVGGNLATASGAADLPSILLPLDAAIVLKSAGGARRMPLERFIRGYRDPDRRPNELIFGIEVPVPKGNSFQKFCKRGSRKALTLSRVSLGFYASLDGGVISEFRAAAGSMSPVPMRLVRLEAALAGRKLTPDLIEEAAAVARDEVNPRKSPAWRKAMTANLVRGFLIEVMEGAR